MKGYVIMLLFVCAPAFLIGQDISHDIEDIIELLSEQTEAEIEFDTFLSRFKYWQKRPINLNSAPVSLLEEFRLLSTYQIQELIHYRNTVGKMLTIYELQVIPGWDLNTIYRILPFVTVNSSLDDFHVSKKELFFGGDHQIFTRYTRILETQKGFQEKTDDEGNLYTPYIGSPDKIYLRYRYKYQNQISYGFTMEKDAGEAFNNGKMLFDYNSAHLFLKNQLGFDKIALGDYTLNIGQGLIGWTGLGFGKSSLIVSMKRQGQGIEPYTSVHENNFLRGAAFTYTMKNWSIMPFISKKKLDGNATQNDTLDVEEDFVSSIFESGFHRTENEIEDRNSIDETIGGARLNFNQRNLTVGVTGLFIHLSKSLERQDNLYNQFYIAGSDWWNASFDYKWNVRNFNLFGEVGMSDNGGLATINGVLLSVDQSMDIGILYRNISKEFFAPFGNPVIEGSSSTNEKGLLLQTSIHPNKKWSGDFYVDMYEFPWLRFQTSAPSNGVETFAQIAYKPKRYNEFYLRYRHETKGRNQTLTNDATDFVTQRSLHRLRFQMRHKINKEWILKSRIEWSWFTEENSATEQGYMLLQDLSYKPMSSPWSFSLRYSFFDTDSYDSRIYAYENDVLYFFSIPAFQNQGIRYYTNVRYKVNRWLDVWVRFAQTRYTNIDIIGSGNEEILGNTRSEFKLQTRIQF